MAFLSIPLAIGLPWALGFLLLRRLYRETRAGGDDGLFALHLGYGFFLGNAICVGLLYVAASALPGLPFWPTLAVLALVTGVLARQRRHAPQDPGTRRSDQSPARRGLLLLLATLLLLHLGFAFLEILHRPVFPWDAWLNWMYRAKVWFGNGAILPFTEAPLWVSGQRDTPYNVAGAHYPAFVPLTALWMAAALGQWSETLVNLPTWFAGVALACGFHGQCRRLGVSTTTALGGTYLLLSLPLLGAHLSLAGQADVWLCGFSGLGLVALLRGVMQGEHAAIALGLLFCLLGLTVKIDAVLWLCIAIALLAALRGPRALSLLALALMGALLLASALLPATALQELAAALEALRPELASGARQALQDELADDFIENYLFGGSWHLLFWISGAALAWLVLRRGWRGPLAAQVCLAFLALQASVLTGVFCFSSNSAWAEDWTAINRLPLHLAPVHVFIWVCLLKFQGAAPRAWRPIPAAGVTVTAVLLVVAIAAIWPGDASRPRESFAPDTLRAVVGGGVARGGDFHLQRFSGGIAIASSWPVSIAVAELPLVRVETGGANRRGASFFWRLASARETLEQASLANRGTRIIDLGGRGDGGDRIVEFGILAYEDPESENNSLSIGRVDFLPRGASTAIAKFWNDWTLPYYWSQKSVHWLPAGASDVLLPLPLAAGISALLAGLALWVLRYRGIALLLPAIMLWAALDARWLVNRVTQAQRTVADYPLVAARFHVFTDDASVLRSVEAVQAGVIPAADAAQTAPLIIVGERYDLRYQMLRARYHAAPRPAAVFERPLRAGFRPGDQVLFLRSAVDAGQAVDLPLQALRAQLRRQGLELRDLRPLERGVAGRVARTNES